MLGTETSTLDAAGDVTATHDMGGVDVDDARRVVAEHLTGDILQVPPMVSALKVGGRRLHELAREGIEVERPPRPVTVVPLRRRRRRPDPACCAIDVDCSSGTYIRSLAADLGRLLGGGAHLREPAPHGGRAVHDRRGRAARGAVELLPLAGRGALDSPAVEVDDDVAAVVANGKVLDGVGRPTDRGPCSTQRRPLLAVYEPYRDGTKPSRPSCWPRPPARRVASPPCRSSPI